MTIGTRLYTLAFGELVGTDAFGNRYYQRRAGSAAADGARHGPPRMWKIKRRKRWVIYSGKPEASAVPPEWNAWLHYTTDETPGPDAGMPTRPWRLEHQPNPTGTPQAYRPPGHTLEGGQRAKVSSDYEPWTPE
ncbi:MAG: NADH:ubiquinone oxidoreductase subunit NDUFA12 [Alphaproteobacteria bacterium]|nr:NADH:ubiquinone oxidoreductase subunit NDUFA12 [Alphaproteobacteria bacterium]